MKGSRLDKAKTQGEHTSHIRGKERHPDDEGLGGVDTVTRRDGGERR